MTELSRAQLLEKRKNKDVPKTVAKVEKVDKVEVPESTETTEAVVKKSVPENKNVKRNAKEAEE